MIPSDVTKTDLKADIEDVSRHDAATLNRAIEAGHFDDLIRDENGGIRLDSHVVEAIRERAASLVLVPKDVIDLIFTSGASRGTFGTYVGFKVRGVLEEMDQGGES